MSGLPRGTVPLLFTDIEGSTRLLHELGERYADVLAEHRRLLCEAFASRGASRWTLRETRSSTPSRGRRRRSLLPTRQRSLGDAPIRVRIGIHTGEPVTTDEGYMGVDVHRAARICGVGHGGQVLLSQTTCDLVNPSWNTRCKT